MGLGIQPAVRVVANGSDVTATILSRFISLRLTDEAGLQSDQVEIVMADNDPARRIQIPAPGAELAIWLGYDRAARYMGLFVVDEVTLAGPPDQVTIRGKASPQAETPVGKGALQTQKTRSWQKGTTLGAMVQTIAADHGLTAAVAADLGTIALPHIDQINESDINLLTRVVREYDAIVKPAAGRLVLAARGASKATSGKALTPVTIRPGMVTRWRVTQSQRTPAGTVVAVWRSLALAQNQEESIGSGEPVTRLRHQYTDQAEATKACQAHYKKRRRAEWELSLTMPGDPSIVAEVPMVLDGFREGVDGQWTVTRAEHTVDSSGYQCIVMGEK